VIEFDPSYHRAAWMQAPLAAIALAAGIVAWATGSSPWWLAGAIGIGLVMPFTAIVIAPTTQRLLALAANPSLDEAATLLERWNRLHAVRSVLGLAAFGLVCVLSPPDQQLHTSRLVLALAYCTAGAPLLRA
jgi:hypothetical protein